MSASRAKRFRHNQADGRCSSSVYWRRRAATTANKPQLWEAKGYIVSLPHAELCEMPTNYYLDIVILLAAAVVGVPLFRTIGLGAVPGFLVAGVAVGPSGLALIDNFIEICQLSELGVVLLLRPVILLVPECGRLSHLERRFRVAFCRSWYSETIRLLLTQRRRSGLVLGASAPAPSNNATPMRWVQMTPRYHLRIVRRPLEKGLAALLLHTRGRDSLLRGVEVQPR